MRGRIPLGSLLLAVLSACGGGKDNQPPTAAAQSLTGTEDAAITGTVQGTDPDNDPLTYAVATQASHGQVTVQSSGAFQYQPTANFNGADSFVFRVTDPSGAEARATVTLTITPVNDAPTIPAATFRGIHDSNITGTVAAVDAEGDPIVLAVATNPTHGTLASFDSQGNFTYTPNPGYTGTDSFTASATDPSEASSTGVITLKIDAAPQANNDTISVPADSPAIVDVLTNDTDSDGDSLTVQITSSPNAGTASVTADNRVSLDLPSGFRGFTRFSYSATDPSGLSSTATAVVFVGTPVTRMTWVGDDLQPGTSNIIVSDFISTRAADAPIPSGQTLDAYSVLYRTNSDQPVVGFRTAAGDAYWAALDTPSSAHPVASDSTIVDIDVHNKFVLYTTGYILALAGLESSTPYGVVNPPYYCNGKFGPVGADAFVICTAPNNSFSSPTLYWFPLTAPGTLTVTQLAPPIQLSVGPSPPVTTPDGTAAIYDAARTDSSGNFHALFITKSSAPGQEIQISPRWTTLNEGANTIRFTPDGKKLLYSGFSTSVPGFCDLYVYDLVNGGSAVKVNGPHDSASCPLQYDISPDSQRVVYTLPPVGQPTQLALYETPLSTPGAVTTLFAGGMGLYNDFHYDEAGNDVLFLGTTAPNPVPPAIYEWHRSGGSVVQLSPAGDPVSSFSHSDDWSMIAYSTRRGATAIYDQHVLNRSVPGQAVQLSNPAATLGVNLYYGSGYFFTK